MAGRALIAVARERDRTYVYIPRNLGYNGVKLKTRRGVFLRLTATTNASIIGNERVVFNINDNSYRLIVAISYRAQVLLVKFIGTHAGYDRIDAEQVTM